MSEQECPSSIDFLNNDLATNVVVVGVIVIGVLFVMIVFEISFGSIWYNVSLMMEYMFTSVPLIEVDMSPAEMKDDGVVDGKENEDDNDNNGNRIKCYDPSTKQYLGSMKAMTAKDVHEICRLAKIAQEQWCKTSYKERRMVLRTIQKYIVHHIEDICRVSTRDSGKTKVDALLGEVLTTCEKIRTINASGELWLQKSYRTTGPAMIHKSAYVEYVPLGIIAPIAPWNYPFHNMMNHIISGIFAGNAVVGKVSEQTSWSSQYFDKIVQQALRAHGHDPNLVQTITGYGEAGSALVSEPLVDKVIFTGSPGIGKKVMETASKFLKPVILELGGKDAMVLVDDLPIKSLETDVVPWVLRGCYQNCGQNCVGVERVLVYEKIHDAFIQAILPKVKALRQGIPLETCGSDANFDCGSMVMESQMNLIQELVDDAVSKGATLHCGGQRRKGMEGHFYEPTILSGVTSAMRIYHEEVFGPVMTIVKVPDNDDNKCIEMVNDSCFGLGSSIYSNNAKRALRIGEQFQTGMLTVNDFGCNYLVQSLPFGGCKQSGFGRFAGIEGLRAVCLERSIVVDRIPGVKTSIPPPINYPVDKSKGLPFASSLIQVLFNESIIGKVMGIIGLIKNG